MIVLACLVIGFAIGWARAGRAGGDRKDRWQWAIAHMMILTVIGVFVTLIIDRMV